MKSILILASRSETSYLLINHLAARFHVALVVFEAPHFRRMLRYRLRTLGAWRVAGQLAFLVYDRLWVRRRSRAQIAALLAHADTRPPDGRLPTLDVDTVNTPELAALVEGHQPAAVVVTGTGIIGKRLLSRAPVFLNLHCGITPRYRGVHGAFWALVEDAPALAGVTVHVVDAGVDTGGIVAQSPIVVEPDDTYRTLPVKQYLAALPLMTAAVEQALAGDLRTYTRTDLTSKLWFSPTPLAYWRFVRRLRRLPDHTTTQGDHHASH